MKRVKVSCPYCMYRTNVSSDKWLIRELTNKDRCLMRKDRIVFFVWRHTALRGTHSIVEKTVSVFFSPVWPGLTPVAPAPGSQWAFLGTIWQLPLAAGVAPTGDRTDTAHVRTALVLVLEAAGENWEFHLCCKFTGTNMSYSFWHFGRSRHYIKE